MAQAQCDERSRLACAFGGVDDMGEAPNRLAHADRAMEPDIALHAKPPRQFDRGQGRVQKIAALGRFRHPAPGVKVERMGEGGKLVTLLRRGPKLKQVKQRRELGLRSDIRAHVNPPQPLSNSVEIVHRLRQKSGLCGEHA
jgi:hypothetical protein